MVTSGNKNVLVLGLVAGACAMFFLQKVFTTSSERPRSNEAWGLFVGVTFRDSVAKAEFKTLFTPFAKYIEEFEPNTLSYIYMDSDQEATRGMIVERYLDKDNAFLAVHKTSETFLEFRKELQKMQTDGKVKLDGESYQEGIGYM